MEIAKIKTAKTGVFWRHKILSLVILFAIIIVGYLAYIRVQAANNKRDFQQARAAIDSIYDDILRSVGKPDNAEVKSYCSKSHHEFTQGDLSCDVDTNVIYGVNNEDEANKILKRVQNQVQESEKEIQPKGDLAKSLENYMVVNDSYHTASDDYKLKSLNCVIGYIYDTARETDLKIKDQSKKPFEITIGCYGPAKQQYYRLAS